MVPFRTSGPTNHAMSAALPPQLGRIELRLADTIASISVSIFPTLNNDGILGHGPRTQKHDGQQMNAHDIRANQDHR